MKRSREIIAAHELCNAEVSENGAFSVTSGRVRAERDKRFVKAKTLRLRINPYPTAFPYGNGMVLHFYQQQESSTNKTVHKVINKGLKAYV